VSGGASEERQAPPTRTRASVAEACDALLAGVRPLAAERVPLALAPGRVLAAPVTARVSMPAWTNASMDGYAVRAADVRGAAPEAPVALPVGGTVAAGARAGALAPGSATRIMTGAPLPDGADAVVRVEDTDAGLDVVRIHVAVAAGTHVRPLGDDFRAGGAVLAEGAVLGAAQLGVLAASGAAHVVVHRRPRVAVLSCGDEIVPLDRIDEVLAGTRIVGSNGPVLEALVRAAGGEPVDLGIAADSPADLARRIADAAGCDALVTSGGMSVGAFDHVPATITALGGRIAVQRVRMRPGGPVALGTVGALGGIPWVGLPGNPVSAFVTAELFVRPLVRRLLGHRHPFRRGVPVVLAEAVTTAAPLTHFLRATVRPTPDGTLVARLAGPQGSHQLATLAHADALLVVPEARRRVEAGESLLALLLDDGGSHAAHHAADHAREPG
jgi:molybdopterin molybdotransferase